MYQCKCGRRTWLDGRAVQSASLRHWSLRRLGFEKRTRVINESFYFCVVYFRHEVFGWPSGLRRQFKALVSSEARVRISSQTIHKVA